MNYVNIRMHGATIKITLPYLQRTSLESIISHIIQDSSSEVLDTQDGEEEGSFKCRYLYARLHGVELRTLK